MCAAGAGAAAGGDAAARAGVPGAALGRRRAAPRALHQPAQRRRALQVRHTATTHTHGTLSVWISFTENKIRR